MDKIAKTIRHILLKTQQYKTGFNRTSWIPYHRHSLPWAPPEEESEEIKLVKLEIKIVNSLQLEILDSHQFIVNTFDKIHSFISYDTFMIDES